jgi:deoxyribodipyrimidine photo-lyase
MNSPRPVIVWFRQDLRLDDNPAFAAAANTGAPLLPIYILDDNNADEWKIGAASRWWLHQSLTSLDHSLDGNLNFLRGKADEVLARLVRKVGASHVFWNRCYEPWRVARDRRIMSELRAAGCSVTSLNGSLLFEPQSITKADGTPYKLFTPFYRNGCLSRPNDPRTPLAQPESVRFYKTGTGGTLSELNLISGIRWYEEMAMNWSPGEQGAKERLNAFLEKGIQDYSVGRNRPDQDSVSRLSPHLHFGEISPHQVWWSVKSLAAGPESSADIDNFLSELGWREFSHYLLYHWPEMPRESLQKKFDRFPWRDDPESLTRWQRGQTGYPIVDAGMRELWRTGYMHNRVRMLVASFLVKNLLLHWHHGQAWFWDTLVDADLANNSASWQWVAGCGADAAPYFRIFNPVTQGQKFDPDGRYVRRYVPELDRLPARFIHNPWDAPATMLKQAGISLGDSYPYPIVDLKSSRARALGAFDTIRAAA